MEGEEIENNKRFHREQVREFLFTGCLFVALLISIIVIVIANLCGVLPPVP